jgi:hypothetical protein
MGGTPSDGLAQGAPPSNESKSSTLSAPLHFQGQSENGSTITNPTETINVRPFFLFVFI